MTFRHTTSITISCDTCRMRDSAVCADCVVTHVLSPPHREALHFTPDELRAVDLLAKAGMVPTLQHREAE